MTQKMSAVGNTLISGNKPKNHLQCVEFPLNLVNKEPLCRLKGNPLFFQESAVSTGMGIGKSKGWKDMLER